MTYHTLNAGSAYYICTLEIKEKLSCQYVLKTRFVNNLITEIATNALKIEKNRKYFRFILNSVRI